MEAQEKGNPIYCEKCFAVVSIDKEFCPECGAPIPTSGTTEGSDREIYPELARANLLRMRSEYGQAEAVCLSILKRYPNNATANALLGDISAERGDPEQAIQWYELALDITPDNAPVQEKLNALKRRLSQQEAEAGAKLLGSPRRMNPMWFAIGLLAFMVLVAGVSYWFGKRMVDRTTSAESVLQVPVTIAPEPVAPTPPVAKPPVGLAMEDRGAMEALRSSPDLAKRLIGVTTDPRTGLAIVTVSATGQEVAKDVAAQVGYEAYPLLTGSVKLTVRVVKDTKLVFVADVDRAMVDQIRAAPEGDATWVDTILANEWPQPPQPENSSVPTGP